MNPAEFEPWDVMLPRAREELGHVTGIHSGLFGLDRADWNIDLEAGFIAFEALGLPRATAPIQVVGTRDPEEESWLWGWDHPSVPTSLRAAAIACRDYGRRWGREEFLARKVSCSAALAWDFTAVARRLIGHEGAYCAPAGAEVFITYGRVSLSSDRTGGSR
jgi:hypothetical protein